MGVRTEIAQNRVGGTGSRVLNRMSDRAVKAFVAAHHAGKPDPVLAALTDLCNVIVNLNEFVYVP